MKLEDLPELHRGDLIEIDREKSLQPGYFIKLIKVPGQESSIDYAPLIMPKPYFMSETRREELSKIQEITVLMKMKDRTSEEAQLINAYLPQQ